MNLSVQAQSRLLIALPFLLLIAGGALITPQIRQERALRAELAKTRQDIAKIEAAMEAAKQTPPDYAVAALPPDKQEATAFLRGLSALIARTGNQLISVQSIMSAPTAKSGPKEGDRNKKDKSGDDLPSDIILVTSSCEVRGDFRGINLLMRELARQRRMVTLEGCELRISDGGYPALQARIVFTRYLDASVEALTLQEMENGANAAPGAQASRAIAPENWKSSSDVLAATLKVKHLEMPKVNEGR